MKFLFTTTQSIYTYNGKVKDRKTQAYQGLKCLVLKSNTKHKILQIKWNIANVFHLLALPTCTISKSKWKVTKHVFGLLVLTLLLILPISLEAKVNVFACEPEWAALAKEVGRDKVTAISATHAKQDPHYIRARPSLIAKMRRADLVICSGAGLEVGWLPILLQKAGAKQTQPGSVGFLMASEFVPILEKPHKVDRSMGDIHPEGNPHIHTNPHNILLVAKELTKRLQTLDNKNAKSYQRYYNDFGLRWRKSIKLWERQAVKLKGHHIITHHSSWIYLVNWLGLKLLNTLEPKPGLPPTSNHLSQLLKQTRTKPVLAIVRTPYATDSASKWLAKKSGIPTLVLPYTIGGTKKAQDLFSLFDQTIILLMRAVNAKR